MRGDVFVEREGVQSKVFKGFKLESSDIITTDKRSKAQLLFEDKTVIRVGRGSKFIIEDYLYKKDSSDSRAKFKVANGFFSAVTGQVGKLSRDNFKLKTKTATIGIRGTQFQGTVSDEAEEIACLHGEIFIETAGNMVDVVAGQILSIKDGVSSAPRAYKANEIQEMEEQDKESLDSDSDNMSAEELASARYDQLASQYLEKTELRKSADGTVTMYAWTWDTPVDKSYLAIEEARPFDVAIVGNKESQMAEKMPTYSWDGSFAGGSIIKYQGTATFVGELSADGSKILSSNGDQTIDITIDTANSYVSGGFIFQDESLKFSSAGTYNHATYGEFGALTSDGFLQSSKTTVTGEGNSRLIFPAFGGYFSGDSIYAKVGIAQPDHFDMTLEEQMDSQIYSGGFIAEKVEEIPVTAQQKGSDNIFEWGYWAYEDNEEDFIRGGWIRPVDGIEVTTAEELKALKDAEVTASYSGDIFGTVENHITGLKAEELSGGFEATFDFNQNSVSGNFNIDSDNSAKRDVIFQASNVVDFETGAMEFNTYSQGNLLLGGDTPDYMYGSGKFYGDEAQNIGGGFTAGFSNGDTAIAGFKGSKQ
jgi:hypothetical protein